MSWRVIAACGAGLALLALAACSKDDDPGEEPSAEQLFTSAQSLLQDSPTAAAAEFERIEQLHPYAPVAKEAMLRASEAYYEAGKFDEAIISAHRFLDFYPGDEAADRALFVVAMSNYDQIADVRRDQSVTQEAARNLRNLIQRYPDSRYVKDAQFMLDAADDHMAGQEMEIGRYYLGAGQYAAAINRFRAVVDEHPTTSHVAEALYRLVEANLALGLVGEARRAGVILGHNFPGSDWYLDGYELLKRVGAAS